MGGFEQKIIRHLALSLKKAGMGVSAKQYIENALKYSCLAAVFFFTVFALLLQDAFAAVALTGAFFAACLGLWAYYPLMQKRKKAELVEKDLPFFLMGLSIELNIENRLEKALKNLCKNNFSPLAKEFRAALQEIGGTGVSLPQALYNLIAKTESQSLKRAVMKMITIYEQGGGGKMRGDAIRSIASEELSAQKAKAKEFSQKLVLYSLMFIVVSAVFPAMFQAFIIIGSTFMKLELSAMEAVIIVTLVFPLLDLGALFYIKSRTPHFLR